MGWEVERRESPRKPGQVAASGLDGSVSVTLGERETNSLIIRNMQLIRTIDIFALRHVAVVGTRQKAIAIAPDDALNIPVEGGQLAFW